MNTIILARLFKVVTAIWLFIQMGLFFKPDIMTWEQNALFWFLWGLLWMAIAFVALLADALL